MVDQNPAARRRGCAPLPAAAVRTGRLSPQPIDRDKSNRAQPARIDRPARDRVRRRVLPVVHAHQHAMFFSRQCRKLIELGQRKRKRLLDEYVRTRRKRRARSLMMQPRRTRDIDKIRRLTIEHQFEVVIHANILDQANRLMSPLRNWVMNRRNRNIVASTPSSQMRPRSNFAKPGNRPAQFSSTTHQRRQVSAKPAPLATRTRRAQRAIVPLPSREGVRG